jgi:hypothetical protein
VPGAFRVNFSQVSSFFCWAANFAEPGRGHEPDCQIRYGAIAINHRACPAVKDPRNATTIRHIISGDGWLEHCGVSPARCVNCVGADACQSVARPGGIFSEVITRRTRDPRRRE